MQTRMKPQLFYTFLTIFAATAVVTLLALTGVVTVVDGYLGWLVSAFLVESAGAVIALLRGAKFFEEPREHHAPHPLKTSAANENDSATLRLPTLKGGWMLCFIGQKQGEILNAVFSGLRKPFSATGDGKEFSSGLAYWGIIPTWNWLAACQDPKYPVMERGLKHFERVRPDILAHLGKPFHYVSLGVGDGRIDSKLLGALPIPPRALYYFPVDFSPEMLRMGIEPVRTFAEPGRREVVPIQLDFAEREYVGELRQMVEQFVNSDPVLFGLVGNTLANFEDDTQLLKTIPSLHAYAPPDRKTCGLAALGFVVLLVALTGAVHFVQLTVVRRTASATVAEVFALYTSDNRLSAALAVELLGWDFFFGFALLFAAPIFKGGKLQALVRAGLTVCGFLCLAGVAGPASGDMRFQLPATMGYAFGFPFVCLLLA